MEGIPSQGLPVIGTPLDLPFSQLINSELLFKKRILRVWGNSDSWRYDVESENSVVVRGLSRDTLICVRNYSNLVIMMILLKYRHVLSRAVICIVGIMVFLFPHIAL